jgi:hypothetical protein
MLKALLDLEPLNGSNGGILENILAEFVKEEKTSEICNRLRICS